MCNEIHMFNNSEGSCFLPDCYCFYDMHLLTIVERVFANFISYPNTPLLVVYATLRFKRSFEF